ncbi:MAG: hydantoinase/oxoprolinase family protein [Oscillospiraceae bacterium]
MKRTIRVGIDVGGTHTKAVALDNVTHEILGKATVMTTHSHKMGVSQGIIEAFQKCLLENHIQPEEIVFIAHSTTQATNALLEGDVATVGIIGMGRGLIEGYMAKRQTKIQDIPLVTGRSIPIKHAYIDTKGLSREQIMDTIKDLLSKGAEVIVASMAFGVDSQEEEQLVQSVAMDMGVPVTMAAEITKLYGLTIRTRTAAINASIMPKMLHTAESIETTVKGAGIKVPLMIMRGDGGVMDIAEMKKRPVLTMLSGPAASVIGALMYLRASNGIYFEVGGTSTNIGVIKNGRPAVNYATLGQHRTYISSLDVRVLGIAGGSMVRVNNGNIIDVGPRSAHIAGMPYAAFTPDEEIIDPVVEYISPRAGDPGDYVVVRVKNGKRIAITNTCAANVLGLATEDMYAHGNMKSCRTAIGALAKVTGQTVEETAHTILKTSCNKIVPIINELAACYQLEKEQMVLVGVGGGAGALLPFTANLMDLPYDIPENAEVISSIGVALAMVREVVERTIPNPTAEDISAIRKEAVERVVNSGAVEDTVEVHITVDNQTQKVTAIALGSSEVQTTDLLKEITDSEAKSIAANSFGVSEQSVAIKAKTDAGIYILTTPDSSKGNKERIRIVDKKGFVKIQRSNGVVVKTDHENIKSDFDKLWNNMITYSSESSIAPDLYLCSGGRLLDCSGASGQDLAYNVIKAELPLISSEKDIYLVASKNSLWKK